MRDNKLLKTSIPLYICSVLMLKWASTKTLLPRSLSIYLNGFTIWAANLVIAKIIFDMACLLTNSSVVRRKVFKPYKTKKLTIVLTILLSFSWANCPTGFIGHKNPDEDVCCKPTSCFPGTFVQHCQLNFTSDVCLPCEANSYQLDFTNSSFPHPCIKANCHPGAMMTSAFSRSGCRLRCKCDEENGYYGEDPCNCKRIEDKTNKERKGHADYEKQRDNLMLVHNQKQIKLVFIAVAITIGLMIMMCFLYLYCELQSRRSTSLNLGQVRPGVYTPWGFPCIESPNFNVYISPCNDMDPNTIHRTWGIKHFTGTLL